MPSFSPCMLSHRAQWSVAFLITDMLMTHKSLLFSTFTSPVRIYQTAFLTSDGSPLCEAQPCQKLSWFTYLWKTLVDLSVTINIITANSAYTVLSWCDCRRLFFLNHLNSLTIISCCILLHNIKRIKTFWPHNLYLCISSSVLQFFIKRMRTFLTTQSLVVQFFYSCQRFIVSSTKQSKCRIFFCRTSCRVTPILCLLYLQEKHSFCMSWILL